MRVALFIEYHSQFSILIKVMLFFRVIVRVIVRVIDVDFLPLYIIIGGGTRAFLSIFELGHWPFSRGLLKNTHKLITQKLLKKYSILRTMTLL